MKFLRKLGVFAGKMGRIWWIRKTCGWEWTGAGIGMVGEERV